MKIDVKQGKGGRWRWHLRDRHGNLLAQSGPKGYRTKLGAEAAAARLAPDDLGAVEVVIGGFVCALVGAGVTLLITHLATGGRLF